MCSGCGTVKAKLSLAERIFRCEGCGLIIDRDVNAAKNLLKLGVPTLGAPTKPASWGEKLVVSGRG